MQKTQIIASAVLTGAVGFNLLIIGTNNILDYGSNREMIKHVMLMDTTFPDNKLMWRAVQSDFIQTIIYISIILTELTASILCLIGSWKIFKHKDFNFAYYGLTIGMMIWFFVIITLGGEWFLMWQSETWNAMNAGLRYFTISALVLIYITIVDNFNRKTKIE